MKFARDKADISGCVVRVHKETGRVEATSGVNKVDASILLRASRASASAKSTAPNSNGAVDVGRREPPALSPVWR